MAMSIIYFMLEEEIYRVWERELKMDGRAADMPPPAHMGNISFLSCSCRVPCFGQRCSGTVMSSPVQVFVCGESVCFHPFLGYSQQKGGGELLKELFCLLSAAPAFPPVIPGWYFHTLQHRDVVCDSVSSTDFISSCINGNAFKTFYCVCLCVPHKRWFWFSASWLFVYVVSAHFMWCWWFHQL